MHAKLEDKCRGINKCVGLIGPYKIRIEGKEPIILKPVTMIDSETGWFEITQYSNNKVIVIANLVETV